MQLGKDDMLILSKQSKKKKQEDGEGQQAMITPLADIQLMHESF